LQTKPIPTDPSVIASKCCVRQCLSRIYPYEEKHENFKSYVKGKFTWLLHFSGSSWCENVL